MGRRITARPVRGDSETDESLMIRRALAGLLPQAATLRIRRFTSWRVVRTPFTAALCGAHAAHA